MTRPTEDRPCAAAGLTSYRYPSDYSGFIMIGAASDIEALEHANRSLERPAAVLGKLQRWCGVAGRYVEVGA